jgi:hypothetical protein
MYITTPKLLAYRIFHLPQKNITTMFFTPLANSQFIIAKHIARKFGDRCD